MKDPSDKDGAWLDFWVDALTQAKHTRGAVIQPVMHEVGMSKMQKAEEKIAEGFGVQVVKVEYSRYHTLYQLIDLITEALKKDGIAFDDSLRFPGDDFRSKCLCKCARHYEDLLDNTLDDYITQLAP